jgi:F-type H+-transporting ATPase subunit gamma
MNIREINELINLGQSLKQVSQAYGEIASVKLRKIRAQVVQNRQFFNEIADVYKIVKIYAAHSNVNIAKPKQTVSVLLTSNQGFYGGIDDELSRYFIQVTHSLITDRVIIGKSAREYLSDLNYNKDFRSLELKQDLPTTEELITIMHHLGEYKQVLVFFPKLTSILVQKPTVADITQSNILQNRPSVSQVVLDYVIFEPELTRIMLFFDNQIISLLLQQAFFEAELARTASRLLSMDQAQIRADKFIDIQTGFRMQFNTGKINNQILENYSALFRIQKGTIS